MVGALGWSSHARSLSRWPGFFTYSSHFLAITLWIGILFNVSWFSKNHRNWIPFLKWFTPLAAFCFLTASATGIILMSFVMNLKDYSNAWVLPYGQMLLLKHLAIIPLLVFAFINGILIRKRMASDAHVNPLPWVRLESVSALIIFSITGALGMQSPPHEIKNTVLSEGVSSLWQIFHGNNVPSQLSFTPGYPSALLLLISVAFLMMTINSYKTNAPKVFALFMGICFIFSAYCTLMLSVK
ncbi:MAG: CopD family protein [Bacillota bacterium]|nr:CopD family protein [Bacillota bacterium]